MKGKELLLLFVAFGVLSTSRLIAQPPQSSITPTEKGDVVSVPDKSYNIEKPFTYQVARGDNLHWLAAKFYGDARQWKRIYEANKSLIHRPNRLQVGLTLWIPAGTQIE